MPDFDTPQGAKMASYCQRLAEELDIEVDDLARALDNCGIALWGSRDGFVSSLDSVSRESRLREMIEAGMGGTAMARELGVSPQRVYQILHDFGLYDYYHERKARGREEKETAQRELKEKESKDREARKLETSRLWLRGVSVGVIAERFGLDRKAMCSRINEYRKRQPELFPLRRVRKKKEKK